MQWRRLDKFCTNGDDDDDGDYGDDVYDGEDDNDNITDLQMRWSWYHDYYINCLYPAVEVIS